MGRNNTTTEGGTLGDQIIVPNTGPWSLQITTIFLLQAINTIKHQLPSKIFKRQK